MSARASSREHEPPPRHTDETSGTWADLVSDAEMVVACSSSEHHVRWHRGMILLEDHDDPDGEEVLAALGAERAACFDVLDLWRWAVRDGAFLEEWAGDDTLGHKRRDWLHVALGRLRREGIQDLFPTISPQRAARMGSVLTEMPQAMIDRAAATVVDRFTSHEPLLARSVDLAASVAVATRVRARRAFIASLARWRSWVRTAALVRFDCDVRADVPPHLSGRLCGRDSWLSLTVGPRWLLDVWAAERALADGHLVVGVAASEHGQIAAVDILDWESDGDGLTAVIRRIDHDHDHGIGSC